MQHPTFTIFVLFWHGLKHSDFLFITPFREQSNFNEAKTMNVPDGDTKNKHIIHTTRNTRKSSTAPAV